MTQCYFCMVSWLGGVATLPLLCCTACLEGGVKLFGNVLVGDYSVRDYSGEETDHWVQSPGDGPVLLAISPQHVVF